VNTSLATSLVLTLLGPDRPGLVERLSQVLVDHEGNWVESRMAQLAGQFAGILRVALPANRVAAFKTACLALATEGLQVLLVDARDVSRDLPARRILKLELIGQDRPGIVREISQALVQTGVNVEELNTGVESAPMSAELLFFAKARLSVPVELSTERLRKVLEPIGNELMVDIALLPSE
jgi:glycine cleavage system regulatory protein